MPGPIYTIKPKKDANPSADFSELLHKSGLLEHFEFGQIMHPVLYLRDEIADHIAQHGLSSLYKFSLVMEDITSPSISFNDIEKLVAQFVKRLDGAKRILIIDPYFYAPSSSVDVAGLFKKLLGHASTALEEIIFVTNGLQVAARVDIHNVVKALVPNCQITDVVLKFPRSLLDRSRQQQRPRNGNIVERPWPKGGFGRPITEHRCGRNRQLGQRRPAFSSEPRLRH